MQHKRLYAALIILGVGVVIASAIALLSVQTASAQCGSQASSCKNCHETQAIDPVNNDGTGWHESHAFGDFCYICHGGNSQSLDEAAAHTGMVDPMSDLQAACGQCHPNDLQARAAVYQAKLGAPTSAAASAPAANPSAIVAPSNPAPAVTLQPAAAARPTLAPDNPNLVDYVQRYNEQVLHQQPTNWGNIVLIALVVLLLLAGSLMVNRREGWISVSFTEKKPLEKDYPADVAGIAAQVADLKPAARKSLSHILSRPAAAGDLLSALDEFSADNAPKEDD